MDLIKYSTGNWRTFLLFLTTSYVCPLDENYITFRSSQGNFQNEKKYIYIYLGRGRTEYFSYIQLSYVKWGEKKKKI